MRKFITKDGSTSFYSEKVKEYYHTKEGAKEEAFEKHALALNIGSVKHPVIFDICFGVGYSTAAALDVVKEATVYCFENDLEILKKVLEIDEDFKHYPMIKEFVRRYIENNQTTYEKENIKLVMVFGDAREEIKKIKEKADFVFFAPFSPAKAPDMWTKEFFEDIYKKMNVNGKLSTYSYARQVRENLKNAGFEIKDGPILKRRSPSLIATKFN